MLVLSRHRDEMIMIGDEIVVTVVDIRGDKVRLGFDAPPDIPIHRREVYEAIQRENRKARKVEPSETREIGADLSSSVPVQVEESQEATQPEDKESGQITPEPDITGRKE